MVTEALAWLERHAPALAPPVKRWFVEWAVPLNRAVGLRVESVCPETGRVVLRLPARRRNRNASGTVHGGVLAAFAETVHGVAVLWRFSPATHHMVTREAHLQFQAPARGPLHVEYLLEKELGERIAEDLDRGGRCEVTLRSAVTDDDGRVVASLLATYLIRRR